MSNFRVPVPKNEPVCSYAPGSLERAKLTEELNRLKNMQIDAPMIIGGREITTSNKVPMAGVSRKTSNSRPVRLVKNSSTRNPTSMVNARGVAGASSIRPLK